MPATPAHLQLLIDMLSDAFLCSTPDGRIFGCNEAACRMFGYARDELIGMHRDDIAIPDDSQMRQLVLTRQKTGAARARLSMRRKGGETFEADVVSVGVSGEHEPQVWVAIHDLAEQRRADAATAALRESNEWLRALSDAAFEGVLFHRDGVLLMANHAAEVIARVPPGGLVGKKVLDFIAPESLDLVRSKIASGDDKPYEAFGRRADGTTFPIEVGVRLAPVQIGGAPTRVVALRDLTARKQLEEEFRQAQKMEAVGRLAGGVAHDFNNMLVVILSGIELAAETLDPSHPSRIELDEVRRAALRAKELTRDLLALSHKQMLNVRIVELGAVIQDMRSMIGRLIGEDIELVVDAERSGIRAKLDPAQLEIMLMNLIVNARDAMPNGGRLVLEATSVILEKGIGDLKPGPHVRVVVSDTGSGMDEGTKSRIFEPFFTTKGPGRGTGLGLSTVFGIVKQSGGWITVESSPGHGSTFSVYFPCTTEHVVPKVSDAPKATRGGRGTVLVVEDELPVRRIVVLSLRGGGYEVLEAPRPDAAIELAKAYEGRIDLLVTDVVMPGMSGRALSDKILAARPDVRVLFVSGYTEDAIVHRGVLDAGVHFLQKPFSGSGLLDAVARVLR